MANPYGGSGNDERETPLDVFDALHWRFNFTVDVACTGANAKMARAYSGPCGGPSCSLCGLHCSWEGERVWCNPPYSDIGPWVTKAMGQRFGTVTMLLPLVSAAKWAWPIWENFDRILVVKHRIQFVNGGANPKDSMVVHWDNTRTHTRERVIEPWTWK